MKKNTFKDFIGMNNAVDPTDLFYDPEKGTTELSYALNVDIIQPNRIIRRKGFNRLISTELPHSLFYSPGLPYAIFVQGENLNLLYPNNQVVTIASTDRNKRLSYVEVNKTVFHCNGTRNGVIVDGEELQWRRPNGKTRPPNSPGESFATFSDPPVGTRLDFYNGRVLVAVDNTVYASVLFFFSFFSLLDSHSFDGRIRFLRSVDNGIYVGTAQKVYFCKGDTFDSLKPVELEEKFSHPVIGTDLVIDGSDFSPEVNGKAILWTSHKGICLGDSNGNTSMLTEYRFKIPKVTHGSAGYWDNTYHVTLFS